MSGYFQSRRNDKSDKGWNAMTGSIQKDIYAEMMHRWLAYAHGYVGEDLVVLTLEKKFGIVYCIRQSTFGNGMPAEHDEEWRTTFKGAFDHWQSIVLKKGLKVDKEPKPSVAD